MDSSPVEETPSSPWSRLADLLPYELSDMIIKALEPPDFLCFGAVCVQWRCLQVEYRQRFYPLPPPLRTPAPWIIPAWGFQDEQVLSCISPPPLAEIIKPRTVKNPHQERCIKDLVGPYGSSHGWLLAEEYHGEEAGNILCLLNPLTGKIIKLPRFHRGRQFMPVMSPPPLYTVFCVTRHQDLMYVFHHSYSDWKVVPLAQRVLGVHATATTATLAGGTLYFLSTGSWDLRIVSAYPTPSVRVAEMNMNHLPPLSFNGPGLPFLVESSGDIFLAVKLSSEKFAVFQADFTKKEWIKLDNLGDRFLILDENNRLCLSTTDLGNGFKRNSIYFERQGKFQIFDMTTETLVTTAARIPISHLRRFMILPSVV